MGIFEVGKGRKPKEKILHRPTAMHGCGNGETNSRRKTGIWKEGRKEGRKERLGLGRMRNGQIRITAEETIQCGAFVSYNVY
jgi:hypothetical protein